MQYTPNFSLEMPDASDPFGDFRQSYNDNLVIIDNNLGGGGGSSSLAGLSDVNLVTPTDGQVLTYDGNSSKWVNANGGSGGHVIVDPNDNDMPTESKLQFTGNVSVSDDNVNGKTIVDILGGGDGGGSIYSAKLLWEGSFSGEGTIDVPNLDQYLVIAVQNDVSVLVIGNAFTGSGALGLYNQASSYSYAYRFNTAVANKLTIDANNRGIMYNGNTTYAGSSWCTITKIYGLVKKIGSGDFAPIIYSDTERKIGVWRDNKPLYQKVVPCGTAPAQGQIKSVAHGIADLETVVELRGFGQRADGMQLFIPNISRGNVYAQTSISVNATNVNINNGNNSDLNANYTVYMIIQYTKTTDVAGSGNWNAEGVPTVHYSSTEQVIGTWLGKPLYQQTIPFSGLNFTGNVDYAFDVSSYAVNAERIFLMHDMSFYIVSNVQRSFIYSTSSPVQSNHVMLRTEVNRNNASGYVTIRYTKTTD